jgi:hypothetical protein
MVSFDALFTREDSQGGLPDVVWWYWYFLLPYSCYSFYNSTGTEKYDTGPEEEEGPGHEGQ